MKTPGVLINANAGRVCRDPEMVERIRRWLPPDAVHVTRTEDEIAPALRALRDSGSDVLAVVGGDGSAGGTLSVLVRAWGETPLPGVVLAGGGSVDTIAHSLGARGAPDTVIARLLRRARPFRESVRPLLRVRPAEGSERHGIIFGAGAPTRFLEHYYARTRQGARGAVRSLAAAVGSTLVGGRFASGLFEPFAVELCVDAEVLELERCTALGASTVRDVGLGFRPFHSAGSEPDRFHFLATGAPGWRLAAELPLLRFGRRARRSCFSHESARRVEVHLTEPLSYMIDADLYPSTTHLVIEAGPRVRFLAP